MASLSAGDPAAASLERPICSLTLLSGCAAGAATARQIEDSIANAGFIDVRITVKPGNREPVDIQPHGREIGDYVAFADDRRLQAVIKLKQKRHIN